MSNVGSSAEAVRATRTRATPALQARSAKGRIRCIVMPPVAAQAEGRGETATPALRARRARGRLRCIVIPLVAAQTGGRGGNPVQRPGFQKAAEKPGFASKRREAHPPASPPATGGPSL